MKWIKRTQEEINSSIFNALATNVNYATEKILGVPASYLDEKVFSPDNNFLKDAPFLSTLVQNPNHIGCHTIGESESFFAGTQQIERELIEICAEDILKGKGSEFDGYIASGGTEANMQAIWIYRNYFQAEKKASPNEIAIICSQDSHYSMDKASNILGIPIYKINTSDTDKMLQLDHLNFQLDQACANGVRYFIVVANMMTTMFGSVDKVEVYTENLTKRGLEFKLHIDGAYGGFYYPFSKSDTNLNFSNPHVSSVTLDAHKMAQAPYGTGVFLIRKGLIHYATTKEASYVEGEDCTLIGSRSGANAIAVWMILSKYGPNGWFEKIFVLQKRTEWLCEQLDELKLDYFRDPFSNIVTIRSSSMTHELAAKYHLVPDNHHEANWYKIVVMEHVTLEKLVPFIDELKSHFSKPMIL
jgi:glutamate/tyrosine decarboxylase-like PLP-dependent enzyme